MGQTDILIFPFQLLFYQFPIATPEVHIRTNQLANFHSLRPCLGFLIWYWAEVKVLVDMLTCNISPACTKLARSQQCFLTKCKL
jgi:hypothetical protein